MPLGLWIAVITDLPVLERSKSGSFGFNSQFKIDCSRCSTRKAKMYFQLEGKGLKFTRKCFDAIGIKWERGKDSGAIAIKGLRQFMNLECKALVAEDKYTVKLK